MRSPNYSSFKEQGYSQRGYEHWQRPHHQQKSQILDSRIFNENMTVKNTSKILQKEVLVVVVHVHL